MGHPGSLLLPAEPKAAPGAPQAACPNLLVPGWGWDWGWLPRAGSGIFRAQPPRLGAIQSFPLEFGAFETQHSLQTEAELPKLLSIYLSVCMYGTVSILM